MTLCESHGLRLVVSFYLGKMKRDRVISLIDGFNLYHAVAKLNRPYLRWLDLWLLSKQLVRIRFPQKRITTIVPPHRYHSNELIQVSSDKSKIRIEHLERCLLPETISDGSGLVSVKRPEEYRPSLAAML